MPRKHCGRFECTPLEIDYETKIIGSKRSLMRMSKNRLYESPYTFTGGIQSAGVKNPNLSITTIEVLERGKQ